MKILQLGKFYPIKGGVEKVMYDLMLGLSARGVDCDMLCAVTSGTGSVTQINPHARLITCRTWVKAAGTTISPSMLAMLQRIAPDYDVIHVHHPDPMAAVALFSSRFQGKVVLHWHSDIVKQKAGLLAYLPVQQWLINRADVVIGTTPDYLENSPYLKRVQGKCIPVPIGVTPFQRDERKAGKIREEFPGKKLVFYLGRLVPYKGLEYLVATAAHLPEDYMIVIGGHGPLRNNLEQQASGLGVADRVRFLGEVPQEDLAGWFTAADLFCLPSVMKTEAFGIVQIEAMSLGTPVVATRIPGSGTAWVNAHGESGLNVEIRDARALAQAIREITEDPEVHARFSRGAKERFDKIFHIDRMIDNVQSIYRDLIPETES